MRRKVSLWVVIVLVGALAATTAAVVVLARRDSRADGPRGGDRPTAGLPHPWSEERGEWQRPMMGSVAGWEYEGEAPILPWVLFAVATGAAVGLLVAWSPWRAQLTTATAGPSESGGGAQASETVEASAAHEATEAIVAGEAPTQEAPPQT
jgi:hypothetical protein